MGIPGGGEKGTEEIFETIMTENFCKSISDIKPQIQSAQRTPSKINNPKKRQLGISSSNYRKSKIKKKSSKKLDKKNSFPIEKQR